MKNKFKNIFSSNERSNEFINQSSERIKDNLNIKYEKIYEDIVNENFEGYDRNLKFFSELKNNDLFDEKYYISRYNLPICEKYALLHYLNEGFKEGFNPSEKFNGVKYLDSNPDVEKANLNPLAHYVLFGEKEGREFPLSDLGELSLIISKLNNEVYQNRILQNIRLLRDKVSKGSKINVVFILPAMMFVYKELYKLLSNDDLFNVQIVVVPHRLGNAETITDVAKEKYYQIFSYLKDKEYNVIEGYDFDKNIGIDLESICQPDIIFYTMPYMRIYPTNMEIDNLPQNILYAYIPYGEFIEDDLDDNLYNFGWNEKIWKIFCSSEEYYINSAKKSPVGSSNVVIAGSARMDSLINYEPSDDDYSWIYGDDPSKKRIIWAPHHTLARPNMDEKFAYSTFDENYKFFYEYAKNHPNIEWVIRPHPLLKEVLSKINTNLKIIGVANEDFADDYFFKWNSLPNARVHEDLDYYDLFATADAMITDCVSFKAEYLYANKPGLILKKPYIEYDGYKGKIADAWYVENGSDFEKIEEFIEDVVVNENDYLKEKREKVFKENFDVNVGVASKFIYEYIKNVFI